MEFTMYMLKDGQIEKTTDFLAWAQWRASADPTVAVTRLSSLGLTVSTVFLGIDHSMRGKGDPVLFETMVFKDNGETDTTERYCTEREARKGHDEICSNIIKEAEKEILELRQRLK